MQATPRERRSKRWPNGAWISWEVRSAKENSAERIPGLHFQRARLSTTGNRIVLFARKASGWAMKDATGKERLHVLSLPSGVAGLPKLCAEVAVLPGESEARSLGS